VSDRDGTDEGVFASGGDATVGSPLRRVISLFGRAAQGHGGRHRLTPKEAREELRLAFEPPDSDDGGERAPS
jgi:hypothetical protein